MCPFYSGNCTKITKTKTQKNPKSFSSNRYCLFTSQQNSLHLAACMKHFSTPDNIESTRLLFFFFLSYCMAVLKLSFFFPFLFFVVFYAKGREASDNLYTVYTAHPLTTRSYPPTPVCIVPEHQNLKAPTPLPKNN